MQYAIANDASIKRASYQTKYLISATLSDFRNLITISDFRNWTIMADFRKNSTTISDFRNLRTVMTSATQQQYLISATEQQRLPSGTATIISGFRNNNHLRNIWSISPTDIYVSISWAWTISTCWNIILQCPLPISNSIINCQSNKHNSAATNVSRCQSRLIVVIRMPCNLSSFSKSKFDLISREIFPTI